MPLDDRLVELINAVVDGEATPDERAQLDAIVAGSPEAQRLFDATREIAGRLDSAGRAEPPAAMRSAIMDTIAARARSRLAGRRSRSTGRSGWSKRRVWFGLGWAAAAAIVVAVVVLGPMRLIGRHTAANSGATMAPHVEYDWPVVATFGSKTSRTRLVVRRDGDLTILEPVVETSRPVVVSLTWDPAAATAVGFSGGRDASSSEGQLTFMLQPGGETGCVIVRPRPGVRSVEVEVSVDSKQVIRAVVPLG